MTDEAIKELSLVYIINKNIKNMRLFLGMNNKITIKSIFYLLISLALNNNIECIELEYNNCNNINNKQVTSLLSQFLHYKSKNGSLKEVNFSGGMDLIPQPLFPHDLSSLQKLDLHVSNGIQNKCDDFLINICSGLQNSGDLQVFSLDFKNNKLTQKGILALADLLNPEQGQTSKLKELRMSLSGVESNSNASIGLPELGKVLSEMTSMYKLELYLNDFNMESESFGEFINHIKNKKGLPYWWFSISYSDNPNIKLKDELKLGEIYAPNYLLCGINIDVTKNIIKISNNNVSTQNENEISFEEIKQIGESIANYPNCYQLDLTQFRSTNFTSKMQRLLKYIHVNAGCNTKSFIQSIESSLDQWNKFDCYLNINKLQLFAIYKKLSDLLPLSIPQIYYDLREDIDIFLSHSFYL